MEYTVLGDAVNLAARLMANAPANGILVDEETRQGEGCRFHSAWVLIWVWVQQVYRPAVGISPAPTSVFRTRCTVELDFQDLKPIKVKGALASSDF